MQRIASIPTVYKGVQMRSRLEATWAAFFTKMGWRWEYEPFDLEGWIPDFLLITQSRRFLIEVKPITSDDGFDDYWPKIADAKPELPVILVGTHLFSPFEDKKTEGIDRILMVGQIREKMCDLCRIPMMFNGSECVIDDDHCGTHEIYNCIIGKCKCSKLNLCAFDDSEGMLATSCCRSMSCGPDYSVSIADSNKSILAAWAEAKNESQWNPPSGG